MHSVLVTVQPVRFSCPLVAFGIESVARGVITFRFHVYAGGLFVSLARMVVGLVGLSPSRSTGHWRTGAVGVWRGVACRIWLNFRRTIVFSSR